MTYWCFFIDGRWQGPSFCRAVLVKSLIILQGPLKAFILGQRWGCRISFCRQNNPTASFYTFLYLQNVGHWAAGVIPSSIPKMRLQKILNFPLAKPKQALTLKLTLKQFKAKQNPKLSLKHPKTSPTWTLVLNYRVTWTVPAPKYCKFHRQWKVRRQKTCKYRGNGSFQLQNVSNSTKMLQNLWTMKGSNSKMLQRYLKWQLPAITQC